MNTRMEGRKNMAKSENGTEEGIFSKWIEGTIGVRRLIMISFGLQLLGGILCWWGVSIANTITNKNITGITGLILWIVGFISGLLGHFSKNVGVALLFT